MNRCTSSLPRRAWARLRERWAHRLDPGVNVIGTIHVRAAQHCCHAQVLRNRVHHPCPYACQLRGLCIISAPTQLSGSHRCKCRARGTAAVGNRRIETGTADSIFGPMLGARTVTPYRFNAWRVQCCAVGHAWLSPGTARGQQLQAQLCTSVHVSPRAVARRATLRALLGKARVRTVPAATAAAAGGLGAVSTCASG